MFEGIIICLSGPICSCQSENLGYRFYQDEHQLLGIIVLCKNEFCLAEMKISSDQLRAHVYLQKKQLRQAGSKHKSISFTEADKKFLREMKILPDSMAE